MNRQAVTMTGERWRLGHRPAIDGVRGLAILLVLCGHLQVPFMHGAGPVGVSVFFTLSGFLITALLLEEHSRSGQISLRRFYERRARRLLPALLVSVGLVVAFAPIFRPVMGAAYVQASDLPAVIFYYGNWVEAHQAGGLGVLGATWSLAVEEQFYLAWPLAVIALATSGRRRAILLVALVGAAASLALRLLLLRHGASWNRIYFGTDTTAFGLLLGSALAAWLHGRPAPKARRAYTVLAVVLIALPNALPPDVAGRIAPPLVVVGATLLLRNVASSVRRPPLESPWLRWFGTRSYGLYLYHAPLYLLLVQLGGWSGLSLAAVVLPVAVVCAEASYRWVEGPFRHRQPTRHTSNATDDRLHGSAVIQFTPNHVHPPAST